MLRTSKAAAWFHSVPYDYSLASTGYEPGTEPDNAWIGELTFGPGQLTYT